MKTSHTHSDGCRLNEDKTLKAPQLNWAEHQANIKSAAVHHVAQITKPMFHPIFTFDSTPGSVKSFIPPEMKTWSITSRFVFREVLALQLTWDRQTSKRIWRNTSHSRGTIYLPEFTTLSFPGMENSNSVWADDFNEREKKVIPPEELRLTSLHQSWHRHECCFTGGMRWNIETEWMEPIHSMHLHQSGQNRNAVLIEWCFWLRLCDYREKKKWLNSRTTFFLVKSVGQSAVSNWTINQTALKNNPLPASALQLFPAALPLKTLELSGDV